MTVLVADSVISTKYLVRVKPVIMRSLMRKIKRRRTSYSEVDPESPNDTFELQSVPDHKRRTYRPEKSPPNKEKEESESPDETSEEPKPQEPPAVILTTPEGLDIDTFAHGLMDIVDESNDAKDEWDTLVPPPLLAEPPRTPTKRRPPPPPRPERPAEVDLSLNTFVLGPPEKVKTSHHNDDDSVLVSPFADPEDTMNGDEEEASSSSWWSAWSSSSSDDASSDSSDSDSESEEMDLQYTRHTAGKTLYAQLVDGFVSFPPLSPDDSDDDQAKTAMKTFLDELDEDDVRDAEELLRGEDINNDDDNGTAELTRLLANGENDWTSAFSRPVPRWWWLKSSNSFPVLRLGPGDLRHGPSKLRQAVSLVDEASLDGTVEDEDDARVDVLYL